MTTAETPFEIGKANVMWKADNPQVALFTTGALLHKALLAARALEKEGIAVTVTNVHTIKPLDRETIIHEARSAGAVVTVEEHQIAGGLGGAVAELLASDFPLPIEFIGVHDRFGQSGEPKELIEHYGMGVSSIVEAVRRAAGRRVHV
jgi:transketolase